MAGIASACNRPFTIGAMSKAFTKESEAEADFGDETPAPPAGTKNYITPGGLRRLQDEFADEFDQLPPSREPTEGWAKTMAGLCRDIARHLRERAKTEDPTADPARENRFPPIRIY